MNNKKVTILLSTYNGDKHLKELLDSLHSQSYSQFNIIVRDDNSADTTLKILNSYRLQVIPASENIGAKCSFSTLLDYAIQNDDGHYFMFCDQDDIWESDKVEKTLLKMQSMEKKYGDIPLLVHTDLKVVDEKLNMIDESFMRFQYIEARHNKLNNLLMQNTITGCTMMINRELAELSLPIPNDSVMHDWWQGLIASQFGSIGYLEDTTILYRQHANNTVGSKGFSYLEIIKKAFKKNHSINYNSPRILNSKINTLIPI